MEPRRGPLTAGEKVQFTDRKGKKITRCFHPDGILYLSDEQ